jgi:nucleoside triphosphate pyrophosphatase
MLVLASASPRRQELLRNAGIAFSAQPADIDETPLPGESAPECAQRLAREKARVVHSAFPRDYVLGADTIVVLDGAMLGKPQDRDDAVRMLRLLSGRTHEVITGVCLIGPAAHDSTPAISTAFEVTKVTMGKIPEDEIRDYVATGDSMDKAGGYGIQGIASRWIPGIEGDYCNVMGLPVALVYAMLKRQRGV